MQGPWRPPRVHISSRMMSTNQKAPGMTRVHTGPTCERRCFGGCHGAMLAAHDPLRNPPSNAPSLCTILFYSLPFLPSILRSVLSRCLLWPTGMFAPACRSFPRQFWSRNHARKWVHRGFSFPLNWIGISWLRFSFRTCSEQRRRYWLLESFLGCTFGQLQALLGVEDCRTQQSRVSEGCWCAWFTLFISIDSHVFWLLVGAVFVVSG